MQAYLQHLKRYKIASGSDERRVYKRKERVIETSKKLIKLSS